MKKMMNDRKFQTNLIILVKYSFLGFVKKEKKCCWTNVLTLIIYREYKFEERFSFLSMSFL